MQITVSADPPTSDAFVEANGRNGLSKVVVNVYAEPADAGMWPDTPFDCLGDAADAEFSAGSPSAVNSFLVRMVDPGGVTSVGERYFQKLNTYFDWSPEDWSNTQNEWLTARSSMTSAAEADLLLAIASTGCVLEDVVGDMPFATIACTNADAESVWLAGAVECMDLNKAGALDVHDNGVDWRNDRQADQFLPNPFATVSPPVTPGTGYTAGLSSWMAVNVDSGVPTAADQAHVGFGDATGSSRMLTAEGCRLSGVRFRCDAGRATSMIQSNPDPHSLTMLGQLAGSTVDGQAGAVTTASQWTTAETTTTPAHNTLMKPMAISPWGGSHAALADRTIFLKSEVVTSSVITWVPPSLRTDCDGTGNREEAVALMFESGVPFFGSAGNYDDAILYSGPESRACNVGRGRAGLATFVSGGLNDSDGRWKHSSHADPAGRRTIVDVMTNAQTTVGFLPSNGMNRVTEGTSLSSPLTASLALVYRHHYESLPGSPTFVRIPDVLYTRLLLQADGTGQSGTADTLTTLSRSSGFDEAWGAGRLNLQPVFEYNSSTYAWTRNSLAGRVCVGDDTTVEIPLPEIGHSGYNDLTFVTRFHDKRHAYNGHLDEIDLRVAQVLSPTTRLLTSAIDNRREEKARIITSVPNGDWVMRITGVDVDAKLENPTCASGQRLVYYAYRWE